MMTSAVVVCSALVACLLVTSSAMDPHQLELKQHYEHLAYIADFPCLKPQPKVIPVHKLFSESQSHGKAYFPDVTVLYRCDECTGSCTAEHKCAPKLTELVLLPFKATYLEPTDKHKVGSWAMEYHELLNHTECGCVPRPPTDCIPDHSSHQDKPVQSGYQSSGGSGYQSSGGSGYQSSGGSGYQSSGGSGYQSSGGSGHESSSGTSGGYNNPQSSSVVSEVNKETTTQDYLSQLFETDEN